MQQIYQWLNRLSELPDMPAVHNLFSRYTPDGRIRLANLTRYFEQVLAYNPYTLLIGEAPGYQGSYRTGVPFCSEAILLGKKNKFGLFGGQENGYQRVYPGDRIWKEPSATIVQRTVDELGQPPLIWATFPLHPHHPDKELSNRAPNASEIRLGGVLLKNLIEITQPQCVVAVGNVAEKCLAELGIKALKVRHPSHGGAVQFRTQLLTTQQLLGNYVLTANDKRSTDT
jgi:uracil-DNA glycosylase